MAGMNVAWLYGPTTAHLAVFHGGGVWESRCNYHVRRQWSVIHWTGDDTDPKSDEQGLPLTPWCSWCVGHARRDASGLYLTGMLDGLTWVVPR
jgi:hypothetical protein